MMDYYFYMFLFFCGLFTGKLIALDKDRQLDLLDVPVAFVLSLFWPITLFFIIQKAIKK